MEKQAKEKKQNFPELSENEKKLLEVVNKGSVDEVRVLLQEKDVKVDCLDESGMTPLQHAVFRGKTDIAELLMNHGADVNSNHHENGYTALMFAALSGSTETTRLMLKHGAKKDATNTVGRTAAQMAAFVGQHQCVAVINNYFDKQDLEYYTLCRGQEKEPKLPPMVLPALLKLLNMANMHPVKVSMHLQDHPELLTDSYKVCKVLDLICEKAMKSREPDEVMGMKAHYLATVIRKAKDAPSLETWIKTLLRGRDSDGHPEFQDQLIRQSLKEFPYVDSILLQNMVKQLSMTKIGQSPTSLNILNQGINGQKFAFDEEKDCAACGEPNAKTCTACKMVHYCNRNCQKLHFPTHKKFCKQLAEEFKRLEKMKEENSKREEQLKKGEAGKQQKPEQNGQSAESQGAKPKSAKKETSGEEAKPPGFLEGFPGASELLNDGGTDSHPDLPDISKLLEDPEIIAAFKDPEISKAFEEVDDDPAKIGKYQDNDKIQDIIHKIPVKLNIVPTEEAGAGGEAGATGGATASGGTTGGATASGGKKT